MKSRGEGVRRGFTLIELLVVIAIIGILAALLFPAVQGALLKAKANKVGSDGRQVWLGLFAENTDRISVGDSEIWPNQTGTTSTAYFRDCIQSNWLEGFSYSSFAAPGVGAYTGTNASSFLAANNAWSCTMGVDENTLPEVPFLFTKNWGVSGSEATINLITDLSERKPFGDKVGVIVTAGGRVRLVKGKDIRDTDSCQRQFNPLSKQNQVLWPE